MNLSFPEMEIASGWIKLIDEMPTEYPDAYSLWKAGKKFLQEKEFLKAQQCQWLIKLMHSSYVPIRLDLGEDIEFAYGGIGIILHPDAEIGSDIVIGSNVLVGGNHKPFRYSQKYGKNVTLPRIGDHTWIGSGSKILGGVNVGGFAIISSGTTVLEDVPVGSIVVGSPGRVKKELTIENVLNYKNYFPALKALPATSFLDLFQETKSTQS